MSPPNSSSPIRVLLADDHPAIRGALRDLLQSEPDIEVILDVGDGRTAVEQTLALRPDVVFLDIRMQTLGGLEAAREIKQRCPAIRVICFSMHHEKTVREAAFAAGADGYLVKSNAVRELIQAVRTVMAGHRYEAGETDPHV